MERVEGSFRFELPEPSAIDARVRVDSERVLLWYGPRCDSQVDAVLSLSPLDRDMLARQREP